MGYASGGDIDGISRALQLALDGGGVYATGLTAGGAADLALERRQVSEGSVG